MELSQGDRDMDALHQLLLLQLRDIFLFVRPNANGMERLEDILFCRPPPTLRNNRRKVSTRFPHLPRTTSSEEEEDTDSQYYLLCFNVVLWTNKIIYTPIHDVLYLH